MKWKILTDGRRSLRCGQSLFWEDDRHVEKLTVGMITESKNWFAVELFVGGPAKLTYFDTLRLSKYRGWKLRKG